MSQSKFLSHVETWTHQIIGQLLAQLVLFLYEVPLLASLKIATILFFLSYIRTYLVRRFFNWLQSK